MEAITAEYISRGPGEQLAVARGNQIYINDTPIPLSFSPGGLREGRSVREIEWSPNGRYIAFTITGNSADDFNNSFYDYGVWVYDTWDLSTEKILHEDDRKIIRIAWSPNSMNLLVQFEDTSEPSPMREYAIVTVEPPWNPDLWFSISHRYSDATWSLDSEYVYVSGLDTNGNPVLGRLNLAEDQRFEPISFAGVVYVHAAIEVQTDQLAFLGAPAPTGPFYLYSGRIGSTPQQISSTPLNGFVIDWDWNDQRTALLVTMQQSQVQQQAWAIDIAGNVNRLALTGRVHWR